MSLTFNLIPASANSIGAETGKGNNVACGTIVILHGWGANAEDLMPLAEQFDLPDFDLIFLNAPFRHPQVPGGKMWYDLADHAATGLTESRALLIDFLQNLNTPLNQVVLMGFSQGGAMTLDVGLGLPPENCLKGLVCLSGYLHPFGDRPPTKQKFPPVLIVHGTQDRVVPLVAAQSAEKTLNKLGVTVEYAEYPIGHEISAAVVQQVHNFIMNLFLS